MLMKCFEKPFKSFLKHFIVMKNKINTLFAEAQSAVTRSIY